METLLSTRVGLGRAGLGTTLIVAPSPPQSSLKDSSPLFPTSYTVAMLSERFLYLYTLDIDRISSTPTKIDFGRGTGRGDGLVSASFSPCGTLLVVVLRDQLCIYRLLRSSQYLSPPVLNLLLLRFFLTQVGILAHPFPSSSLSWQRCSCGTRTDPTWTT